VFKKLYFKWKRMSLFKKIITVFLLVLISLIVGNCRLVSYAVKQGIGQIRIVNNARPIGEVMQDTSVSEDLKQKLLLVDEIKQFAIDSLGLNPSKKLQYTL
jgi:predicted aminopeptidase